jgi:hypothetical protein
MAAQIPPGTDLNLIPAGMPPEGVLPTIGGGPSLATATTVLEILMMSIATVTVSTRMFSSWRGGRDPSSTTRLSMADCKWHIAG